MTNQQFEEAESLIRKAFPWADECPTCGSRPDQYGVRASTTYRYAQEDHTCNCEEQLALLRHYALARIPTKYMRYSAGDWRGDQEAFKQILDYSDEWLQHRKDGVGLGLYCKGLGRGKTFLATYIARDLILQGERVAFTHFESILRLYSQPFEFRRPEEDRLRESTVLVLDEVSNPTTGPQQAFYAREFENLIRYRGDYNKPTIFTTNLEPSDLEEKFPRVYSLLADTSIEVRLGQEVDEDFRHALRDKKNELKKNKEVKPIC